MGAAGRRAQAALRLPQCPSSLSRARAALTPFCPHPPPATHTHTHTQKKADFKVEDIETEDGVLVLTADNFDAAIKAYDPLL